MYHQWAGSKKGVRSRWKPGWAFPHQINWGDKNLCEGEVKPIFGTYCSIYLLSIPVAEIPTCHLWNAEEVKRPWWWSVAGVISMEEESEAVGLWQLPLHKKPCVKRQKKEQRCFTVEKWIFLLCIFTRNWERAFRRGLSDEVWLRALDSNLSALSVAR